MVDNNFAELLVGIAAADVADSLQKRFMHRAHVLDLKPVGPSTPTLFGQALTVSFLPVRDDLMDPHRHSLGPALYRALSDRDPIGKVLVMAANGFDDLSLGGSTKLSRVENLNMAGVVADARLRDHEELAEFDFPTYCRGEAVRGGGDMVRPYISDTPVVFGGVTVVPGDYIFADHTGLVVVPESEVEGVMARARAVGEMGHRMRELIRYEDPSQVLSEGSKEA